MLSGILSPSVATSTISSVSFLDIPFTTLALHKGHCPNQVRSRHKACLTDHTVLVPPGSHLQELHSDHQDPVVQPSSFGLQQFFSPPCSSCVFTNLLLELQFCGPLLKITPSCTLVAPMPLLLSVVLTRIRVESNSHLLTCAGGGECGWRKTWNHAQWFHLKLMT